MPKKNNGQQYLPDVAVQPKGMPPADLITNEVLRMGLTKKDADAVIDHWLGNGFRTGRHKVYCWTAVLRTWKRQKWFPSQKTSKEVSSDKRIRQLADLKELRRRYNGDGQNRLL
jgi:hypothetical protein